MEEDNRVQMKQNIKNILDNHHSRNELGRMPLPIVDSTANILKRTNEEVNINFIYNTITQQLTSLFEDCEKTRASLIRLLIDIPHGRLSTNILKPSQLKREISKIEESLSETLELCTLLTARGCL